MKIERGRLKKSSSEVPLDCKLLVEKLKSCSQDELLQELQSIKSWNWGKVGPYFPSSFHGLALFVLKIQTAYSFDS